MNNIFKIKKEERLFALVAFLLIVAFNVLMVTYHYTEFSKNGNVGYWTIFTKISRYRGSTHILISHSPNGKCIIRNTGIRCFPSFSILDDAQ